jgi:hypothetical protein
MTAHIWPIPVFQQEEEYNNPNIFHKRNALQWPFRLRATARESDVYCGTNITDYYCTGLIINTITSD